MAHPCLVRAALDLLLGRFLSEAPFSAAPALLEKALAVENGQLPFLPCALSHGLQLSSFKPKADHTRPADAMAPEEGKGDRVSTAMLRKATERST